MGKNKEIKNVRNIIMNELGITRELIQKELKDLITIEIEKLLKEDIVQKIIENSVRSFYMSKEYKRVNQFINDIALAEAQKIMREFIKNNIAFEIKATKKEN